MPVCCGAYIDAFQRGSIKQIKRTFGPPLTCQAHVDVYKTTDTEYQIAVVLLIDCFNQVQPPATDDLFQVWSISVLQANGSALRLKRIDGVASTLGHSRLDSGNRSYQIINREEFASVYFY